jgi:hypothetical protein
VSRTISSPVRKWPGTVTLADPLTFPQYLAWKDAIESALGIKDDYTRHSAALLPGLCACVETWGLEGLGALTPETFPASPRRASDALLTWLVREINRGITEADEPDPNSPPPSTAGS